MITLVILTNSRDHFGYFHKSRYAFYRNENKRFPKWAKSTFDDRLFIESWLYFFVKIYCHNSILKQHVDVPMCNYTAPVRRNWSQAHSDLSQSWLEQSKDDDLRILASKLRASLGHINYRLTCLLTKLLKISQIFSEKLSSLQILKDIRQRLRLAQTQPPGSELPTTKSPGNILFVLGSFLT